MPPVKTLARLLYPLRLRLWFVRRCLSGGVGVIDCLKLLLAITIPRGRSAAPRSVTVRHPRAIHPLQVRVGSSDAWAFLQIFPDHEYRFLDGSTDVKVIVDLGANCGYAAAYFLSRFPDARVLAVEPDGDNVTALERNLAPYGERAECLRAGAWSSEGRLEMREDHYRDGAEWSRQVRAVSAGETGSGFPAVDVPWIMARLGCRRVSILKCDIEGAEVEVFGPSCRSWIERCDAIAVELHDDTFFGPATPVFERAISGLPYEVVRFGELTICRRIGG